MDWYEPRPVPAGVECRVSDRGGTGAGRQLNVTARMPASIPRRRPRAQPPEAPRSSALRPLRNGLRYSEPGRGSGQQRARRLCRGPVSDRVHVPCQPTADWRSRSHHGAADRWMSAWPCSACRGAKAARVTWVSDPATRFALRHHAVPRTRAAAPFSVNSMHRSPQSGMPPSRRWTVPPEPRWSAI